MAQSYSRSVLEISLAAATKPSHLQSPRACVSVGLTSCVSSGPRAPLCLCPMETFSILIAPSILLLEKHNCRESAL